MTAGLTPELSHAGRRTQANPRLPGRPAALPGVGSGDLGNPTFIDSKFPGQNLQTHSDGRPRHWTGKL